MEQVISKTADFTIKIIIMFTTFLLLVFFADYYNNQVFTYLAYLLLAAVLVVGLSQINNAFKKR